MDIPLGRGSALESDTSPPDQITFHAPHHNQVMDASFCPTHRYPCLLKTKL